MRNYKEISEIEKLEAVMACLYGPAEIKVILELGEIENLSGDEINIFLTSPHIKHVVDKEYGDLFWIETEHQPQVLERLEIDRFEVLKQIADVMDRMRDIDSDELDELDELL